MYLESADARLLFYDINANSDLPGARDPACCKACPRTAAL
jgi:hypothetical protein